MKIRSLLFGAGVGMLAAAFGFHVPAKEFWFFLIGCIFIRATYDF